MKRLIAIRPFKYGARHFVAGDAVEVRDRHALVLRAGKKARLAKDSYGTSDQPNDIGELRARASQLGVKVDMRWRAKRLQEEIAKS